MKKKENEVGSGGYLQTSGKDGRIYQTNDQTWSTLDICLGNMGHCRCIYSNRTLTWRLQIASKKSVEEDVL
jgi:hypothetical protein